MIVDMMHVHSALLQNKEIAVEYRLGEIRKHKKPLSLNDFGVSFPPQSFVVFEIGFETITYIDDKPEKL